MGIDVPVQVYMYTLHQSRIALSVPLVISVLTGPRMVNSKESSHCLVVVSEVVRLFLKGNPSKESENPLYEVLKQTSSVQELPSIPQ